MFKSIKKKTVGALLPPKFPELKEGETFVRLMWNDAGGVRRCRLVSVEDFKSTVYENGLNIPMDCMQHIIAADKEHAGTCSEYAGPVGDIQLVPVVSGEGKLHQLPWYPNHSVVEGRMMRITESGLEPWAVCPRNALQKVISNYSERGWVPHVGFDFEFQLFHLNEQNNALMGEPISNEGPCCTLQSMEAAFPILDEATAWLKELGIMVEQARAGSAPGQFKMTLPPMLAMDAVDALNLAKDAVHAAACKHSMMASFLPTMMQGEAGNSIHCHVSITHEPESEKKESPKKKSEEKETKKEEKKSTEAESSTATESFNLLSGGMPSSMGYLKDMGLSEEGGHLLAGMNNYMPSLLALLVPSANSFRRFGPGGDLADRAFRTWGPGENRAVPLRVCTAAKAGAKPSFFEFRFMDATANAHVALAALLWAGMMGVNKKMPLPPPATMSPSAMTEAQRTAADILALPDSQAKAQESMKSEFAAFDMLGEPLMNEVMAVMMHQGERFKTFEEEVKALWSAY